MIEKNTRYGEIFSSFTRRSAGCLLTLGIILSAGCSQNTQNGQAVKEENVQEKTESENQKTDADSEELITFTDDLGQEISVNKPKRVAVLIGSFADEWVNAGGRDSLVAAAHDTFTSFDIEDASDIEDLGEVKQINAEKLLASEPDLVIASAKNESQKDLKKQLDQAGIPVAYFDVSDFDDYLRTLKIFTDLTGDASAYEKSGSDQQEEINEAIERRKDTEAPKVLYIRATGSSVKSKNSKGSVLGEMLEDLNTVNIADQDKSLLENLSAEAILAENPDAIFIVYQGSDDSKARKNLDGALMAQEAWDELYAVQNNQVYVMDQSLYNLKPNARWAEAYKNLAQILNETTIQ